MYCLDEKTTKVKEFPENMVEKANQFGRNAHALVVNSKDDKILYSENSKFFKKEKAPTVSQFTKDCKISVYDQIKACSDFEKNNKEYLSTKKGKQ